GKSFITATFTQLEGDLYKVNQSTIDSFYETFSQSYSRIDRIPNMTKEQKNLAISEAYARAQRAGSHAEQTFVSILNSMAAQVQKMVEEIGDSPS
ncbi:MAG: hypothetical protein U1D67_10605, partial [Dehalococcoidia bacterium]|nr:hypothetical protein [Dehalococcoidia bacterium]